MVIRVASCSYNNTTFEYIQKFHDAIFVGRAEVVSRTSIARNYYRGHAVLIPCCQSLQSIFIGPVRFERT
jgi:hypothetical protein